MHQTARSAAALTRQVLVAPLVMQVDHGLAKRR
jgi:hypothetical protein